MFNERLKIYKNVTNALPQINTITTKNTQKQKSKQKQKGKIWTTFNPFRLESMLNQDFQVSIMQSIFVLQLSVFWVFP